MDMSGCENDDLHHTRDYCPHCSTCHLCIEEMTDDHDTRVKKLEDKLKVTLECIKVASFMLGYNGGYDKSQEILSKIIKDLESE